jgi:carbamoyltransferase
MYILGLSCFYHDSAICLLKDGVPVAAVDEQSFTRKKHDSSFPVNAIRWALTREGIDFSAVEAVAFYDKPLVKFERILKSHVAHFPKSFTQFVKGMPSWFNTKLRLDKVLSKEFGYTGPICYGEHHRSHAASSFYASGWDKAAILTVDGVGEWSTTTWGIGEGTKLHIQKEIRFPHSLGLLYSAFTYYLGFKVNSGEYKVMGLAPYGEPKYIDRIKELIHIREDGSFRLNMKHFCFDYGMKMYLPSFEDVMGKKTRPLDSGELPQFYKDVARSLQEIVNEVMCKLATNIVQETGETRLCMAGGVALNCVANGQIIRNTPVTELFVQPAAGDNGGAMGAALWLWHEVLGKERSWKMTSPYLGPEYSDEFIEETLKRYNAVYTRLNRQSLLEQTTDMLKEAMVVGWYQGRQEWGPRALGHRSILGDPRHPDMREIINMKIKMREGFRPFAPSVIEEDCNQYFDLSHQSPYMLLVAPVLESIRNGKDPLPSITHVDGSARVQTVNKDQDPLYHDLLHTFKEKTNCSVLINTSMNVRGEPIVNTPEDAYRCFMRTEMDGIAMGSFLLHKKDQPTLDIKSAQEEFGLD